MTTQNGNGTNQLPLDSQAEALGATHDPQLAAQNGAAPLENNPAAGANTNEGKTPAFEDILTESLGESFNLPKELMTSSRSITEFVPRGRITSNMVALIIQLACEESLAVRGYIDREIVLWWLFNAPLAVEGAARQEAVSAMGGMTRQQGMLSRMGQGMAGMFGGQNQSSKAV